MDRLFNLEQWRIIAVSALSPLFGYLTPTKGFMFALILMFAFNIWAGMRADGVAIVRCKNFSFRKFKNALFELVLYLVIIQMVYFIMVWCGDSAAAIVVVKSLTYVFMYVYLQNSFRNLIVAYPKNMTLRIVYHVIRFEFTRALPSYVQSIIERIEREHDLSNNEGKEIKNETKG